MNTQLHTFESFEALEQTVIDQKEEITKLRNQIDFLRRDQQEETDKLRKQVNYLQEEAERRILNLTSCVEEVAKRLGDCRSAYIHRLADLVYSDAGSQTELVKVAAKLEEVNSINSYVAEIANLWVIRESSRE